MRIVHLYASESEMKKARTHAKCDREFDKYKARQTDFYYRFEMRMRESVRTVNETKQQASAKKIICRKRKASSEH